MSDQAGDVFYYDSVETDLGPMLMVANKEGLCSVSFQEGKKRLIPAENWSHDVKRLAETSRQLKAYFSGRLERFDLPLVPTGTTFQKEVWKVLREIPFGETITYGELAGRVGNPQASRAVGNANGRNPIVIIQPCHRVVAAGGKLGGFSSGLHRKRYLLELEKRG